MFNKSCHSLQALELHCGRWCNECGSNSDFLFSYFPSRTHCRMSNFHYSGLKYAITNCYKLKYLYEEYAYEQHENLLPLSNIFHLQQLYIYSDNTIYFNVIDELTHPLSAWRIVLHAIIITVSSIITLIKNSPNPRGQQQSKKASKISRSHIDFKISLRFHRISLRFCKISLRSLLRFREIS